MNLRGSLSEPSPVRGLPVDSRLLAGALGMSSPLAASADVRERNGAAQVPGIQGSQVAGEASLGDQSSLGDQVRSRHFQPPASSLQHQEPNRQLARSEMNLTSAESTNVPVLIANFCDIRTSAFVASDRVTRRNSNRGTRELEPLLTRSRINTHASSNRGQFGHPRRMAVLSEQREPKDLLSSYSPPASTVVLFTLNEREGSEQRESKDPLSSYNPPASTVVLFTLNEREGSEQREPKDRSRNCGARGGKTSLNSAFLIDTACQLEMDLTPANQHAHRF